MEVQVRLALLFTLVYSNIYQDVQGSCSHKITNSSGTLHVVENVSGPKYCTYTIQKSDKAMTHIRWVYLNARGSTMPSCTTQFVRISLCTNPKTYLVRYCGSPISHIPHDFFFEGGCIQIDTYNNPGFELTYDNLTNTRPQIKKGELTVIKHSNSLNIFSPNWPNAYAPSIEYNSYDRYKSEYRIDLSKNQDIKIIFMAFHTYAHSSSRCFSTRDDILIFKFLRKDRITEKYSFCGYKEPFTKFYKNSRKYQYVDVIFDVRTRRILKGFALGVILIQDNSPIIKEAGKSKEDGPKPVLAAIPVFGLVILAYCCRKKARESGGFRSMFNKMRENPPPPTATFVPQQQQQQIEPPYMITDTMPGVPLYPPPAYTLTGNAFVPPIDSSPQYPLPPPGNAFVPPIDSSPQYPLPPPGNAFVPPIDSSPQYPLQYPLPPPPVYSEIDTNKKREQSTEL